MTTLLPILKSSPVLSRLKHLQSSLDPDDIEGLARIFSSYTGQSLAEYLATHTETESLLSQPTAVEWSSFSEEWNDESTSLPLTDRQLRLRLMAFLLSATFKDCSVFLSLRPSPAGTTEAIVKVIDLDSKPMSRLPKYLKADQEIVQSFRERLESGVETSICRI